MCTNLDEESEGIYYIYLNYSRTDDWVERSAELVRELVQMPEIQAVPCTVIFLMLEMSEMGITENMTVVLLENSGGPYVWPSILGDDLEQDRAEIERVWNKLEVPGYTVIQIT